MNDLVPLFMVRTEDGKEEEALPRITDGKRVFKAAKMVSSLAKAIEEDSARVLQGRDVGLLTIAAYVAMEELLRQGQMSMVSMLKSNHATLEQASYFVAIGILAGRKIPKGIRFETTTSRGTSLRKYSEAGDDGEDVPTSGEHSKSGMGE